MISETQAFNALCRTNFYAFAARAFSILEPGETFDWNWHLQCICDHLEAAYEGIERRLIFNLPPRTLKSFLVARAFPAWVIGKNPGAKFIVSSYGYEVAEQNSIACRRIMKDPWYKQLFPGTLINPDIDRNMYFATTKSGQYYAASALSPITGIGCDYCFIGSTKILTQSGYKRIDEVQKNEQVWSLNHETGCCELRTITALFSRVVSQLVQIETINGHRIVCTPDHPFWVRGQGYTQAKNLKGMDELISAGISAGKNDEMYSSMRLLRKGIFSYESRLSKILTTWPRRLLLFQSLFKAASQLQDAQTVYDLSSENIKQTKKVLRILPNKIFWKRFWEILQQTIFSDASNDRISGRFQMRDLFLKKKKNDSPYRRGQTKQFGQESNHALSEMSFKAPPKEFDYIRSVVFLSGGKNAVYDITVEGNHNFFAEGILVHNCILDDPIKPMEAGSETIRSSTNENIRTTFFSRFNDKRTGRFILVMQRVHEDDPTGHLNKDGGYKLVKLPAEAKADIEITLGEKHWKMSQGDLLFPARLSREILDQTRIDMSEYHYVGQYLQEPVPIGGGEFKEEWLQWYQTGGIKPKEMNLVILVDPAGGEDLNRKKKKSSDWTVMVVLGLAPDKNYYLLDMIRDRLNPTERVDTLFMLVRKWVELSGKTCKVGYERYSMQADTHYIKEKQRKDAYNFPLIELGGNVMKEERIRRLIPDMQNGRIYFPATLAYVDNEGRKFDLITEMKGEMANFPRARWDDMLDAISRLYEPELYLAFPKERATMVGKAIRRAGAPAEDGWESF